MPESCSLALARWALTFSFETKKFWSSSRKIASMSSMGILFRHLGQTYLGEREKTYIFCPQPQWSKPANRWTGLGPNGCFLALRSLCKVLLWNQCNTLHKERKAKKQPLGPKPVHLFAGLLHCGCGQKMYVFSRPPKYVCPKCRNKIPMEDIEAIFRDELQNFFVSKEKVKAHLASANEHLSDMKVCLAAPTKQLEKGRTEMRKVYQLYQTDQISPEGFGKLYRPLEDQERALAAELPKLQGQVDAIEIHQLAADDVVAEASNLHTRWPTFTQEEKRRIIESITEKIVVKGDEIDINLCYMPSSEELTNRQRNL